MLWRELQPDAETKPVSEILAQWDCLSALAGLANLSEGICLYATRSCVDAVLDHARSQYVEIGGLLLGKVYSWGGEIELSAQHMIFLTNCIPSPDYRNSPASLQMSTAVWGRAGEVLSAGCIVVGWYHSHPHLGAFFSHTDRRTQGSFFRQPYSTGWVVDPFRDEQRFFIGPRAQEYTNQVIVIGDELGLA